MTIHLPSCRRRALLKPLIMALVVSSVISCAKNPVTGKREFMLMSESQEVQLGRDADQSIVDQYGLVENAELLEYVETVGEQLVAVSHRPDLGFTFRLLDDPIVNAFALPGGYVYLTRGILAYLSDEAAMAGVLGHEVGHVTARHGAQRYTQQQLFGLGLGLGSVFSETFARFSNLAGTAAQLLLLKYGRDDERQSDELGVEYATRAGYDTREMASFFHTLDRLTENAGGGLPSWASTHPDPGERYETVGRLTQEWQRQVGLAQYRSGKNEYLRLINGLVFGNNPRHGYVKDDAFVHPDLRFTFPVPAGWKIMNTATQVQLASPNGEAAVLFTIDTKHATPREAADAFIDAYGARPQASERITINTYEAYRLDSEIDQQQGVLRVLSTWISKDGRLFVFHGLGTERATQRAVADGFGALVDREALDIQPIVVHVITAPRAGTFESIVADHPIPEGAGIDVAGLALLNGVRPDDKVRDGEQLKIVRRQPR